MNDVLLVFVFLAFAALAISMMVFHFSRARSILERWAEDSGYEIISSEHRFLGGPFWWRKSKGQEVYYVTIRTPDGQIQRGWVRCGGWLLGILSDHTDVVWDE